MLKREFIQTIEKALTTEYSFRDCIEDCYNNWARENTDGLFYLPNYAEYLEVELDCLIDWISTDRRPPKAQKHIEKLWNKYGFAYCFVADTPPPASLFPEGTSSKKIRSVFELLKAKVTSEDIAIEELLDIEGVLNWMSSKL